MWQGWRSTADGTVSHLVRNGAAREGRETGDASSRWPRSEQGSWLRAAVGRSSNNNNTCQI